MNTAALSKIPPSLGEAVERVVLQGDLSKLSPDERVIYYNAICRSVGLNPLTRPMEFITLNGKLTLYARRDCTDQLRQIHGVSIRIMAREVVEDVYVVTAQAANAKGRTDESIGAVPLGNLQGEARANAMMKAETKAKRRVTLSVCGLGMLDENEVESVPGAVAPKWTSGTENAPKHVGVMTLAKELPDAVHEDDEMTADVDVVDQKSGEVVRRPGASSGQIGEIHRLLDKLGHQMDERVPAKTEGKTGKVLEPAKLVKRGLYYKHMMAKHGVKHSNELSSGGASEMIDWLLRCVAKFEKKLGAEPTPALPERCADGTCHRCAMCVEIDAQAAREAE